jgi:hypothetical protein
MPSRPVLITHSPSGRRDSSPEHLPDLGPDTAGAASKIITESVAAIKGDCRRDMAQRLAALLESNAIEMEAK